MHKFACFSPSGQPQRPELQGAHLVGADSVPVRGDIEWEHDLIVCTPRTQEPIGLSLLWPVDELGTVQLQTTRLPAREKPYHLHVELARHMLMRISVKREEWGLFDYSGMEETATLINQARDEFIRALQTIDEPAEAARHADLALRIGLEAAEQMCRFHAEVFLTRRQQTGGFARPFIGASLPRNLCEELPPKLSDAFDFVRVPVVWREVQPTEQATKFNGVEACIKACNQQQLGVRAGPLLNFGIRSVPDWMYIWENDFESIYDAAREFVQRTVKRFAKSVSSWVVTSGLHADSVFGFSLEQIMELTRMAATVTKQIAPRSQVIIELSQPWGEYYARNQQTVPPFFYADMAVQSGINFDGFGLELMFGLDSDGYHVRDPLQISALIDKLANLGKPLHITGLTAPSAVMKPKKGAPVGGHWRAPWSDETQARWLISMCEIALSKPYVETVCLQPLVDSEDGVVPAGGLLRADLQPKPVYERLVELRRRILAGCQK